jgi:hypothetical protein
MIFKFFDPSPIELFIVYIGLFLKMTEVALIEWEGAFSLEKVLY